MKPTTFVYFVVVYYFLYPFFVRYFGIPYVIPLYVNLVFPAYYIAWTTFSARRAQCTYCARYQKIMVVFALLIAASALLNSTSWFVTVKTVVEDYFPFLFIFLIVARTDFEEQDHKTLVNVLYLLIILQIPVSFAQYLFGGYSSADSNSGTLSHFELGGTDVNAVLCSFLVARTVSRMATLGITWKRLLLTLLATIPVIVGGAKFGFLLVPLGVVFALLASFYTASGVRTRRLIVFGAVVLLFAVVYFGVAEFVIPSSPVLTKFLDFDIFVDASKMATYDKYPGAGRFSYFTIISGRMARNWASALLGFGADAIEGSSAMTVGGGPFSGINIHLSTGVSFFASLGIFGVLFLFLAFLSPIVMMRRYSSEEPDPESRSEAHAFVAMCLLCIASLPYTDVWRSHVGLVYWTVLAVIVRRYSNLRERYGTALAGLSKALDAGPRRRTAGPAADSAAGADPPGETEVR